jgi:hypothetical protein
MTEPTHRSASTCRWAVPTISLPDPVWTEADQSPWTCVRDATPRVLETTERCAACPRWEPRLDGPLHGR